MNQYKIFLCPQCGTPLYCSFIQKTKKCPICQKRIDIKHLKVLKIVDSIQDAIFLVKNLKVPLHVKKEFLNASQKPLHFKSTKEKFIDLIQKKSINQTINEKIFFKEVKEAGFSEDWVLEQLNELEKQGLLIRPSRETLYFLL